MDRGGVSVIVEAIADASREKVEERGPHSLRISVKEPARGNAANARLRQIVALRYNVPIKNVRMRTGARSSRKRFDVILAQ